MKELIQMKADPLLPKSDSWGSSPPQTHKHKRKQGGTNERLQHSDRPLTTHHSLRKVVIDKVFPGDFSPGDPEEEVIHNHRPEERTSHYVHPKLPDIPRNVTLEKKEKRG